MKKYRLNRFVMPLALLLTMSVAATSCLDDLDRFPTNDTTSEKVYATFQGYKEVMAKCYVGNSSLQLIVYRFYNDG